MLGDLPSWCAPTYLDIHCWWLMSRNFAVFFFLFELNKPINHRLPLDINLNFFFAKPKVKVKLIVVLRTVFRFSPCQQCYEANKSPHPLWFKLSKFQKTFWFVCLIHHQTFTSMSYIYLTAFHILYDQINS